MPPVAFEYCQICYEDGPSSDFIDIKECKHRVMTQCLADYVNFSANNNKAAEIKCPIAECDKQLDSN